MFLLKTIFENRGSAYLLILTLLSGCASVNYGHRGGCEHSNYRGIPENSILCLEAGLRGIQGKDKLQYLEKFKYLEIDVRETKDGIVVYHGGSGGKVFKGRNATVPFDARNIEIVRGFDFLPKNTIGGVEDIANREMGKFSKDIVIRDLSTSEVTSLFLEGDFDQNVPEIRNYFNSIVRLRLESKLMVEIKDVQCGSQESEAHRLINLLDDLESTNARNPLTDTDFDAQEFGFLVLGGNVERLGGAAHLPCWCKALEGTRLRFYKTGSHRLMFSVMTACDAERITGAG